MKPIDVIKQAEGTRFEIKGGRVEEFRLLPPLSEGEIEELEARLPCSLPAEARELLSYCRGFEGVLGPIDFSGLEEGFGMEEIFPCPVPIAHDGSGNYWIVDVTSESETWGPIFFACHDAPVIVYQTGDLAHFIGEVLRLGNPPWESEIDEVHENHHRRIWRENPGMLTRGQCLRSNDPELAAFAGSLYDSFLFIDLRNARAGDGFSWGRYGPGTVNRRFGEKRIFAYRIKKSIWQRLFGK